MSAGRGRVRLSWNSAKLNQFETAEPDSLDRGDRADARVRADGARLTARERGWLLLVYWAAACALAALGLRGFYSFGRFFGTFEWLINFKRRRRFARALHGALGRSPTSIERRHWGREYFMQNRCDRLFYLVFDRIPRERALELFTIGNPTLLDAALAQGRGVYVALSHHGPHHVAGMLMAIRGYRVAGVRDRREGRMRRFVQARFDALYPEFRRTRVLFADGYPRDIYRCFQEGYAVGSAMDIGRIRDARQKTEPVNIFGEQRRFVSGPLRIALRCKAPVLQGFIIPRPGFHYHLELMSLVPDAGQIGDEERTVRAVLQQYATNVERHIRERPSLMTRV